jgi:hypothetical protein
VVQQVVRVEGLEQAKAALRQIAAEAPGMARRAVRAGAAQLGEGMERRAPELSDELKGSIPRSIHMRPAGPLAVDVGTDHGLAESFEYGGEITPTRKQVLASTEQGIVFGRQVTVPARPFIRPAVDEDRAAYAGAVRRSAERSIDRMRFPHG